MNTTASLSAGADPDIMVKGNADTFKPESHGNPVGSYAGVVPGSASAPPVPAPKTESRPLITWPGFQMKQDGTSRVFVQSTTELSPMKISAADKFSVYLPGAKVSGNTNRLPLETRFFNTPVSRVNIEEKRDGVTLVLDMRGGEVEPIMSSERGPSGFYFLYIDLPKGQYVKAQPATAEAPPAPPSMTERAKHLDSSNAFDASATAEGSARGSVESSGGAKVKANASGKAGIKLGL